jgi:hypothetical protein
MKKVAFILKGITFLRSLGPLIYFSNDAGILPVVISIKNRKGKEYDSIKTKENLFSRLPLKSLQERKFTYETYFVDDENDIPELLRYLKIENICCQDSFNHHQALSEFKDFRIFSISAFFDTIHLARQPSKLTNIPYKVYFPNKMLEAMFKEKSGINLNSCAIGSPWYDHALFVKQEKRDRKSVLFLTPDHRSLALGLCEEIAKFSIYCEKNNIDFLIKDRIKAPWPKKFTPAKSRRALGEYGFPYTSMQLIINTDIHITSYGTSIFEALYLKKPVINLEICEQKQHRAKIIENIKNPDVRAHLSKDELEIVKRFLLNPNPFGLNDEVKKMGLNELFNNSLCKTIEKGLIKTYEDLNSEIDPSLGKSLEITMTNNNSLAILKDILKEMSG